MTQPIHPDLAVQLTDALCRIRSFDEGEFESHVAFYIQTYLKTYCPWLTTTLEHVADNRPNVIAYTGSLADCKLLIVGHIDTVAPSPDHLWTVPEFSIKDGKYYARGSGDAKGGIAGVLDGMRLTGETQNVAYLFYVDEEFAFAGMKHFVTKHPDVQPDLILSACGGSAEMTAGCRGCIEFCFALAGTAGHAARPQLFDSVVPAIRFVTEQLETWCDRHSDPYRTSINVAALHVGLLKDTIPASPNTDADISPEQLIPEMRHAANNVPNVAWALVDIRPGDPTINPTSIEDMIEHLIGVYNAEHDKDITLEQFYTRFAVAGYHSPAGSYDVISRHFERVHEGRESDANVRGYIDVAMIHGNQPTSGCVCLAPLKANEHSPDEWVDIASLLAYRDGVVRLLSDYQPT